ncbi:dephospho-CoA kinase [Maribacter vaceletii]|uniref:Dephospho-CoA kinase n=1 Tax=Maribacter vaceletii TaxID=1206816 RepID=A0A495E8Y4_9FLAO|nr:dephospho-CoA kinase [Maribacter vaceletii]RKR13382.1 dephospho-CoA kinase [Maribacter vaceletii]
MKIIGLTGGIGSGKTTVANLFIALGVPVYNSDREAKILMNTSKILIKEIKTLLGEESYKESKLNRPYIAGKVFKDKELLQKLNAIVHPAVRENFLQWVSIQNTSYVIQETALLYENNASSLYDAVILVTAPEEVRVERVLHRDATNKEAILARINNQLSDKEKIAKANFVIENIDIKDTEEKVEALHKSLLAYS